MFAKNQVLMVLALVGLAQVNHVNAIGFTNPWTRDLLGLPMNHKVSATEVGTKLATTAALGGATYGVAYGLELLGIKCGGWHSTLGSAVNDTKRFTVGMLGFVTLAAATQATMAATDYVITDTEALEREAQGTGYFG